MTTGVISNYLENKILGHTIGNTSFTSPGTSIYVALFTSATSQDDANSGTEVSTSGTGYGRVQVTAWNAPSSGSTANTNAINFTTATADWGVVRYVGIMDNSTGGNLLFWGQLTEDKEVGTGDTFSIAAGDLDLYLGGAMSYALSGSVINHTLRNTPLAVSGSKVYAALYFNNPGFAGTGTEVSGSAGYSRKNITQWSTPVAGSIVNAAVEAFGAATSAWGSVSHVGIKNTEGSTGGDLLYFGALSSAKNVGNGDTFRFSASALSITVG